MVCVKSYNLNNEIQLHEFGARHVEDCEVSSDIMAKAKATWFTGKTLGLSAIGYESRF